MHKCLYSEPLLERLQCGGKKEKLLGEISHSFSCKFCIKETYKWPPNSNKYLSFEKKKTEASISGAFKINNSLLAKLEEF